MLAPHPDDETLGAGGLLSALLTETGEVTVAFLTDGSASHVGAPGWSTTRIAALRRAEAGAALRLLGYRHRAVSLDWCDAAPHHADTPAWEATARRLVALCRRRGLSQVVTSWSADPHCDHEAAAQLAIEVARRIGTTPRFFGVWSWTRPDLDQRLKGVRACAVPLGLHRARARRALGCHRSQLGSRIYDARENFVLPRAMRRLVDLPYALLLEPRHAA